MASGGVKMFRVGTFFHNEGRRSFVTAYLRDYNPGWTGCVEYDIQAHSGKEAKRLASQWRRERETGKTKS